LLRRGHIVTSVLAGVVVGAGCGGGPVSDDAARDVQIGSDMTTPMGDGSPDAPVDDVLVVRDVPPGADVPDFDAVASDTGAQEAGCGAVIRDPIRPPAPPLAATWDPCVCAYPDPLLRTDPVFQQMPVNVPGVTACGAMMAPRMVQLASRHRSTCAPNPMPTCTNNSDSIACPIADHPFFPQNSAFEVVLKSYLQSLTAADFTIPAPAGGRIAFDRAAFDALNDDELFRYWLLFQQRARELPEQWWAAYNPSAFTYGSLTSGMTLRCNVQGNAPDPNAASGINASYLDMLLWTHLNFPGNPFYQNAPLRRRAFALATIDLVRNVYGRMQSEGLVTGPVRGFASTYVGGRLARLAMAYDLVENAVAPQALAAFEVGLRYLAKRFEFAQNYDANTDMHTFGWAGMWHLAHGSRDRRILDDANTIVRAEHMADWHPAGYFDHTSSHVGGMDMSYEGITRWSVAWAALVSRGERNFDIVRDTLRSSVSLRSHLIVEEPNHALVGTTVTSPATADDSSDDQYGTLQRDAAIAALVDDGLWMPLVTSTLPANPAPPTRAQMLTDIQAGLMATTIPTPSRMLLGGCTSETFPHDPLLAYTSYAGVPGLYATLQSLAAGGSPLLRPPLARGVNVVRRFPEQSAADFVAVRLGDRAAVIHSGPAAQTYSSGAITPAETALLSAMSPEHAMGFGGGQLATYWRAATGAVLNARARGGQNNLANDLWVEMRGWAVHALNGYVTVAGQPKPFSSARIVQPTTTSSVSCDGATVTITGVIGGNSPLGRYAAPGGSLAASPLTFTRTLTVSGTGVAVSSVMDPGPSRPMLTELYESLPVWVGSTADGTLGAAPMAPEAVSMTRIELITAGGASVAPSAMWQNDIAAIVIHRFTGTVRITLDMPRRVRRGPDWWTGGARGMSYMNSSLVWPLHVDLRGTDTASPFAAPLSIRYTVN
jgi:hypothetical protein